MPGTELFAARIRLYTPANAVTPTGAGVNYRQSRCGVFMKLLSLPVSQVRALFVSALLLMSSSAMAADKITLMLDWFLNPDHGPIIIAQENGYFKDAGLEVKIVPPADPADPPKLVAAGKADLAVSYQPQLHLQVHEGLPLMRVGTLVATPLNCLLVLADGPIKKLSDLKGRKVGFSVAGVEEALLSAILKKHDLSFKISSWLM
jgi:putative hydroxymethylpyrimidine transport system substrate-binding protein